jgi:hypothetical protein
MELRDADSRRALADAQELYASAEAHAIVVIKQEEDLAARTHQVNQRAQEAAAGPGGYGRDHAPP